MWTENVLAEHLEIQIIKTHNLEVVNERHLLPLNCRETIDSNARLGNENNFLEGLFLAH